MSKMDIFKGWKNYLKKEKFPYQIYCDMDGVLVDFLNPVLKKMNEGIKKIDSLSPKLQKYAKKAIKEVNRKRMFPKDLVIGGPKGPRDYMFAIIRGDANFWADLPWTKDGKKLWEHIKHFKPMILTAPALGDNASIEGKKAWIKKNLGKHIVKKAIFDHKKYKYANNTNLLIDDFKSNIVPFKKKGGKTIYHKEGRTKKTIKLLEQMKYGK